MTMSAIDFPLIKYIPISKSTGIGEKKTINLGRDIGWGGGVCARHIFYIFTIPLLPKPKPAAAAALAVPKSGDM